MKEKKSITRKKRIVRTIVLTLVSCFLLALIIPFSIYGIRSASIDNSYSYLFTENKITEKKIDDVPIIKQDVSCGYAIIEMLSDFYGNKVTENELFERNNKSVSTQTTGGFVKEINKCIPNKNYKSKEYLKNDQLLLTINKSLLNNNPVAVEWAALMDTEWTLHWSIVTGMDLEKVYVNNPYGYKEEITYDEFISRTTFKAFKNMHIGFHFGFAYGLFSKNTIIVSE